MVWDGQDYSCAYDSLFTILYHIWNSDTDKWNEFFDNTNKSLFILQNGFEMFNNGEITIEEARVNVRYYLHT